MLKNQEYRIAPAGLATADQIMAYGIMLPCHPTMTREDCEYVYQTIQDWIDAKGEVTVKRLRTSAIDPGSQGPGSLARSCDHASTMPQERCP